MAEPVRIDRRSARHSATRAEILDVAWDLARERGLTGWSLRDVADAVGMRPPSLYVYFASKNAMYDAMFADGYAALIETLAAIPAGGEPTESLRSGARLFIDFAAADAARYQLLFLRTIAGFEPSGESYALATAVLDRVSEVVVAAGGTPGTVDLCTALFTGLASQQISNDPGGDRWRRLLDDAVALLLAHIETKSRAARRTRNS